MPEGGKESIIVPV